MIKRSAGGDQLWVYCVKLLSGGFRWWGRVWVPGGWFRRAAVWVVVLLLVVGCSGSRVSDRPVIPLSGSAEEDAGGVPSVVGEAGDVGVEPIRLGLVMASSGGLASLDSPVVEALRYAVRQVNESGGLLEMLHQNDFAPSMGRFPTGFGDDANGLFVEQAPTSGSDDHEIWMQAP